jgi:hypothetical protein
MLFTEVRLPSLVGDESLDDGQVLEASWDCSMNVETSNKAADVVEVPTSFLAIVSDGDSDVVLVFVFLNNELKFLSLNDLLSNSGDDFFPGFSGFADSVHNYLSVRILKHLRFTSNSNGVVDCRGRWENWTSRDSSSSSSCSRNV